MKRRDFLKTSTALSLLACCPTFLSADTNYTGKLLITVLAYGGWDPTSFCDPKINIDGQPIINNWAKTQGIQKAGNISYAPFAKNKEFFSKHYKKMLVINGIDQTTNSHSVGNTYAITGTTKGGYPSVAALLASTYKTEELMPWINSSVDARSGNLIAPTFVNRNQRGDLKYFSEPNENGRYLPEDDVSAIRSFRNRFAKMRSENMKTMPKQRKQYDRYIDATYSDDTFKKFLDNVDNADTKGLDPETSANSHAIVAISALAAGVSLSAEYSIAGFDTHGNHDSRMDTQLGVLTDSVDLIWNLAEQFGMKDRLIVQVISDLGRENKYNGSGKEHGTTNSTIIMGDNPSWGNRVVGKTTNNHHSQRMNFDTLKVDSNGIKIEPKDVTASLRNFFGISSTKFDLDVSETLDLFNPGKTT